MVHKLLIQWTVYMFFIDVNSAPTITNKLTTPVSVSENVAVGTTVRQYTATDVNGGTLTYSATYNPTSGGTYFSIVSTCKHY